MCPRLIKYILFRPSKAKTTDEDEAFTGEIKKHQDLEVNDLYIFMICLI